MPSLVPRATEPVASGDGPPRELSMSELLDEDLPIPEAAAMPDEPEPERVWLSDLLDENLPIPDPSGLAPPPPREG